MHPTVYHFHSPFKQGWWMVGPRVSMQNFLFDGLHNFTNDFLISQERTQLTSSRWTCVRLPWSSAAFSPARPNKIFKRCAACFVPLAPQISDKYPYIWTVKSAEARISILDVKNENANMSTLSQATIFLFCNKKWRPFIFPNGTHTISCGQELTGLPNLRSQMLQWQTDFFKKNIVKK